MFVQLSIGDENNRILDPIAVEVKSFAIYGFTKDGVFVDVTHMDGEKERLTLASDLRPFAPMHLNGFENHGLRIVNYPSGALLSKAEWRNRVPAKSVIKDKSYYEDVE